MTVIACKDGVMAADTGSWHGNVKPGGRATKIVRLADGSLFGAAGWKPTILVAREWLNAGMPLADRPDKADDDDLSGIMLKTDMSIWNINHRFELYPSDAEIDAVGSHTEFLYGAMLAGASAEEAVRLAIKHCNGAAGEVQVERIALLAAHIGTSRFTQKPFYASARGWV